MNVCCRSFLCQQRQLTLWSFFNLKASPSDRSSPETYHWHECHFLFFTPGNVSAVQGRLFSTVEGSHQYSGGCAVQWRANSQYSRGCAVQWRANISTIEAVQYSGGLTVSIVEAVQYSGGLTSVQWRLCSTVEG